MNFLLGFANQQNQEEKMKSIYATKKLQSTELYQELQKSLKDYYEISTTKEKKQKSYVSRLHVCNTQTGELSKLDYDFEKEYKKYHKLIEQKSFAIEYLANELGYTSVFLTFTLPSRFHPFISRKGKKGERIYVAKNEDFAFTSLDEAIEKGYIFLNELIRTFYKRVKNYVGDKFFYIKVCEPHATMIPHLHYVCFFPSEYLNAIKGVYQRVITQYELHQVDFEECKFRDNIQSTTRYLLKYITKDIADSKDNFTIRSRDGWKRKHKIRVVTSSDIGLNQFLYKKLYYALSLEIKSEIDAIIKAKNISYYTYFKENTTVKKHIQYLDLKGIKSKCETFGNVHSLFKVELKIHRIRSPSTKNLSYRVSELTIKHRNKLLYSKSLYVTVYAV